MKDFGTICEDWVYKNVLYTLCILRKDGSVVLMLAGTQETCAMLALGWSVTQFPIFKMEIIALTLSPLGYSEDKYIKKCEDLKYYSNGGQRSTINIDSSNYIKNGQNWV